MLKIPETQAKDVAVGQIAEIDTRNGIVAGHVRAHRPVGAGRHGASWTCPRRRAARGARPDLSVDGTIEIERLDNVLYVGRPASAQPDSDGRSCSS